MPNVSNGTESYAEATQILQGDGFTVVPSAISDPSQPISPGVVYNQNPPAGTVKPKGTSVTIFYEPLNATPTATPSGTTSGTPTASATPTTSATPTGTPTSSGTPTPGT